MSLTLTTRRIIAAFLTWVVPFLIAVPFYGRDGTPVIDISLFKSLMIVVSSVVGAILIIWVFRSVEPGTPARQSSPGSCGLSRTGRSISSCWSACSG